MNSGLSDGGFLHQPVLLEEVLEALAPRSGGTYLDCTLGGGGHAAAVLERGGKNVRLIGVDRDEETLNICRRRLQTLGGCEFFNERFENLKGVLKGRKMDGILMDLGLSSLALDLPERGFSFQSDGPLDMRMDRKQPLQAAEIVNTWAENDLAAIFKKYGEEPNARRIASRIVRERKKGPLLSTLHLARVVKSASPSRGKRIHPATRVFMALRIAVNGELENLQDALEDAVDGLNPGGRLAVISFHSLEDRIVKRTFARLVKGCVCPPKIPICVCGKKPLAKTLCRKPVIPSREEVAMNPRARSAKLRVLERLAA